MNEIETKIWFEVLLKLKKFNLFIWGIWEKNQSNAKELKSILIRKKSAVVIRKFLNKKMNTIAAYFYWNMWKNFFR